MDKETMYLVVGAVALYMLTRPQTAAATTPRAPVTKTADVDYTKVAETAIETAGTVLSEWIKASAEAEAERKAEKGSTDAAMGDHTSTLENA